MTVVGTEAEKRADLTRVANLQANELGQPAVAIDTWLEIQRAFVDPDSPISAADEQITESLATLYVRTDRWSDLAELLGKAGAHEEARLGARLVRLGDAFRDRLADPRRAIDCYARALQVSPANEAALAGARALLEVPSCRAAAVEALARALEARGDWAGVLQLAEIRVQTAADDAARVRLLAEAAALAERRVGDAPAALSFISRAVSLAPDDAALERELARLGAVTRNFGPVVEALRAAAAGTRDPLRAARLRHQEGQLDEVELQDLAAALDAYRAAYERDPGRMEMREALVRTAARSGQWPLAVEAALAPGVTRDNLERTYLPLLEALCTEADAWAALAEAAAAALAGPARIGDPVLARDLEVRLARWWEAAGGDKAVERASVALARAAAQARAARDAGALGSGDGFAASEPDILRRLAGIQRHKPGRALVETLLQLADLTPADLDPLREAAAVALESKQAEPLRAIALGRLLDQATRLLRAGQTPAGRATADEAVAFAALALADLEAGRPDRSAWSRAVEPVAGRHPAAAAQGRHPPAARAGGGPGQRQAARPAPRHPGCPPDGGRRSPRTSRRWAGWPACTTRRSGCPSCWACARRSWPAPRRSSAG